MQVKGRYLVVAWTAVFLAAAAAIVLRDGRAFPASRRLAELDGRIRALEGIQADLEAKISALQSLDSLRPRMAALGLRRATDSETTRLIEPARP